MIPTKSTCIAEVAENVTCDAPAEHLVLVDGVEAPLCSNCLDRLRRGEFGVFHCTFLQTNARAKQEAESGAASIRTMRRWGISWKSIIKCKLGFHCVPWHGVCGRCGKTLGKGTHEAHCKHM